MSSARKLILFIFPILFLVGFIWLSDAKTAFACDPNKYSSNDADTYVPLHPGQCGNTGGQADCFDSATRKCWPPYYATQEAGCQPGFGEIKDWTHTGIYVASTCKASDFPQPCCKFVQPRPSGSLVDICAFSGGQNAFLALNPIQDQNYCNDVNNLILSHGDKNYCADPTYHYVSSPPSCRAAKPSGWASNVANTCRSVTGGQASGIATAIGCIPTGDLVDTAGFLMRWIIGISGGVILLMVIITGYNILTSQGNPEKLQASKENIISIFSGLLLIAFSLILLKAVGADILGLPGF